MSAPRIVISDIRRDFLSCNINDTNLFTGDLDDLSITFEAGTTLSVQNGGVIETSRSLLLINSDISGLHTIVDGPGSALRANVGHLVFNGKLEITDGGLVDVESTVVAANLLEEHKLNELIVDGDGSELRFGEEIVLGAVIDGEDRMVVRNGARLTAVAGGVGKVSIAAGSGVSIPDAELNIRSGATATICALEVGTNIDHPQQGRVTVTGIGSKLTIAGSQSTVVGGSTGATGVLTIENGGELVVAAGSIVLHQTGTIDLLGGRLEAQLILAATGSEFNFTGGAESSVVIFGGDLTNQSGRLAPGNSAGSTQVLGDFTQQLGAVLETEIGGTVPITTYDRVTVAGDVDLAGLLELFLIDDFVPSPSGTFAVLTSPNLVGFLDNTNPGQRLETTDGLGSFIVN